MDKYEYKVRSEEISKLIEKEKYAEAVKIADTIDWRRVKSPSMLLKIAALYRISRRNEDSREMLMLAYERYPTNRSVVYSLCELSIELDDVVAAIEYYKQFAKLAPKDNGVYTLRYRILEAQEASLEERIEILEELKKKDYQEEWAYELAYLYHRVGLSTKCAEECDDIILWFGDGPYVMKAMELKAKHVPLTEIQQQNYEIMLGNAGQNYSGENYGAENYDAGDYGTEGYDGQNYGNESYDGQDYSNEGYDGHGYYNEGYDGQDYNSEGYAGQDYSNEGYDAQNYNNEGYDGQDYEPENYDGQNYGTEGYDAQNYDTQGYGDGSYDTQDYGGQDYGQGSYGDVNDSDGAYENETYGQEAYPDQQYADDTYTQNNYVDDGYGNLSYVDGPYPDNGYTSEFYVEQTYDENGNLISPETYDDNYPQEEYPQDTGYAGQTGAQKEYRNGLHVVESPAPPAGNPGDMSQYNTINLQKVVAESMKELFPDDNDDVFAEDRAKYNSGELVRDTSGDTRIFTGVRESPTGSRMQTGRVNVAQMVTGVSEAAPEPHTGAIKKVLVPGDDARSIKSDSNMEELRDTTEKTVDDEHIRMEHNDENVYHEQSLMDGNAADETQQTQTGPMKLDDVLVEWERMKQDNAKQNQENIKKRVLSQTGKIFADFDNSIKSGILGELEREEAEAERRNQESSVKKGKDGFLDADITGDIPQKQASDEDFDVAYVTDHNKPPKLQEAPEPEDSPEDFIEAEESGAVEEQPAMHEESIGSKDPIEEDKEAVGYTKESGAATANHGTASSVQETSETVRDTDDETDVYTQGEEQQDEASGYESGAYTQKIPTEGIENYGAESDFTAGAADAKEPSSSAREGDPDEYTGEPYAEDVDEYTAGAYVEGIDEYNDDVYTDAPNGYNEDAYTDAAGEYTEEIYTEDTDGYASGENTNGYGDGFYGEDPYDDLEDAYSDTSSPPRYAEHRQNDRYHEEELDPEDAEGIAEMAREDALKTQEIKMNTADLSSLSEKIVATTKKEASGAKREEIRDFTPEEQTLFENFAVTKKIKKQIIYALENMTLTAYTGNVIITGDAGLDTVRMAKNLVKEYQALDESFSGKLAKITGEKINQRNIKDVFEKLNNGGIIIEKANGMSEEKLYELATSLNQDTLGIVVIMEDTKKEITKLLEKQAMIVDYFNIRIDLMEMDNNALVAYAKNYALALEYSIDELGTLALYTRIANMQSGNHVVTKDEVRDIIDEAIWKSKKSKIKNFVDVLFARRYDNEDMIVLKERDFM